MNEDINIIENVTVTDAGAEGVAVARHEGIVIFIKDAVPGDIVDVKIYNRKKKFMEGKVINIHKSGDMRAVPFCGHYGLCGGCKWQHMKYEGQLHYKQKQVEDALTRLAGLTPEKILPIIPSEEITEYRNKMEFTFSCNAWLEKHNPEASAEEKNALGFHIAGMFNKVLDIRKCYLQPDFSNTLRLKIKEFATEMGLSFYDVKNHEGFVRNLVIRNTSDGQWMVIMAFGHENKEKRENLLNKIKNTFPELTSLMYVINEKKNDIITDLPVELYYGRPFITESMNGLKYKIGPVSFYQTNPLQAAKLYSVAKEFAGLTCKETVYDLYTGTGTIANYIARDAKKVIGIDNVGPAIEDARENSSSNNIKNTTFVAGDLAKVFTGEFTDQHGLPDVVITDPPRSGMHNKVIDRLLEILPEKIVYVSCNPATQARDIALLSGSYTVKYIQPVDMFPHTSHVENVALLVRE